MNGSAADNLLINTILGVALEKKATDVHLMAGNYPVLRLDSKLFALADEKILTVDTIATLVDSILTQADRQRLAVDKEVRAVYTWANRARFRATVYYQQGYPAVSLRRIADEIPDPQSWMIPPTLLEKISGHQGLVIVCGPFNSGRTTTVMSILQDINMNQTKRIVTLERPIEYVMVNRQSLVNQREVGKDTPSFVQGMKDLLDEDVDVVAVSEMEEAGAAELVLTLAESGKLVFAVMNTTSTISALEKFVGMVAKDRRHWAEDALTGVLLAILAQRLVPAVGGGKVLACELMTMSAAVASIIQEEKFLQLGNVLQTSREEGMISLDFRLMELVRAGKISSAAAKLHALDPNNIR